MSTNLGLSSQLGDIKECNDEQIHLSGAIQGHGCVVFFSWPDQRVQNASENTKEFLGLSRDPLGSKLAHTFEPEFLVQIEKAIKLHPWKTAGVNLKYQARDTIIDAYLYFSEGVFGIELEKIPADSAAENLNLLQTDQELREFMYELKDGKTTAALALKACESVRRITGIDRVMMYQFIAPYWHGEVIAEDRVIHTHSFAGHRFPASDIPRPARDLYLRNQTRLISDVDAPIFAIKPPLNFKTEKKLDLSDSRLRSVSPIHLEYLRNMGVQGSMSFAVTVRGQLWGLIACHHLTPFRISQGKRNACEMIANAFAAQGPLIEELDSLRSRNTFELKLKRFLEGMMSSANALDSLFRDHVQFDDIFDSTGMAFVHGEKVDGAGLTPPRAQLLSLAARLRQDMELRHQMITATSNLSTLYPELELPPDVAGGVLAVQIPTLPGALFMLFRPQIVKTITWGGDPQKNLERKNFQGKINPRESFQAWKETIRSHSKEWATFEIEGVLFLRDFIFESLIHKQQLIHELSADITKLRGKSGG